MHLKYESLLKVVESNCIKWDIKSINIFYHPWCILAKTWESRYDIKWNCYCVKQYALHGRCWTAMHEDTDDLHNCEITGEIAFLRLPFILIASEWDFILHWGANRLKWFFVWSQFETLLATMHLREMNVYQSASFKFSTKTMPEAGKFTSRKLLKALLPYTLNCTGS